MNLDQQLRAAANRLAEDAEPPFVDLVAVRHAAHARRRRTTAVALACTAVAAAAVIVAAAIALRPSDDRPEPVPPPPPVQPAARSAAVWADGDGIHVGRRTYATADGAAVTALAMVREGVVYADGSGVVWHQPAEGGPTRIGRMHDGLNADPAGSSVAWLERSGRDVPGGLTHTLVVYDTDRGEEVARADLGFSPLYEAVREHVPASTTILHVDDEWVVIESQEGSRSSTLYGYDRTASRLEALDEDVVFGYHPAETREPSFAPDPDAHWVVDHAGTVSVEVPPADPEGEGFRSGPVTAVHTTGRRVLLDAAMEPTGLLGRDGRLFLGQLFDEPHHLTVVADTLTGEVVEIGGPTRHYPWIAWGHGDTVMIRRVEVLGRRDPAELLACDALTARCRPLPHTGDVVLPIS